MNEALAGALRRARTERRWSIRRLAEEAGVSTATIVRYEGGPPEVVPKTLDKLTTALGVARARQSPSGEWSISDQEPADVTDTAQGSEPVVADGGVVLALRVPPGFLEGLTETERADLEADALLTVMQLAREARRAREASPGS